MKLQPIASDVIIHPIEESTQSGLITTVSGKIPKVKQGVIIAKGPNCSEDIQTADHVLFSPYSGDEVERNPAKVSIGSGGIYTIIPEAFIVAIFTDSDVVLVDTLTMKRILEERKGELLAVHSDDSQATKLVLSVMEDLFERIDSITVVEGFEG